MKTVSSLQVFLFSGIYSAIVYLFGFSLMFLLCWLTPTNIFGGKKLLVCFIIIAACYKVIIVNLLEFRFKVYGEKHMRNIEVEDK